MRHCSIHYREAVIRSNGAAQQLIVFFFIKYLIVSKSVYVHFLTNKNSNTRDHGTNFGNNKMKDDLENLF